MKVKELMHNGVETLPPDTSMLLVAKSMKAKDIGAIAIQEKDQLIGMITDRDIVLALADGHDLSKLSAKDVMSKDVEFCRDTDQVSDALKMMESRRIRRLPVIDHHKKLVGMIGIGDISHKAPHELTAKVVKAVSAHH